MKSVISITLLALALTSPVQAASEIQYQNEEGCVVTVENRSHGKIIWVQTEDESSVVGFTHDLKSADFVYCAPEVIEINSFTGANGTGILIGCNEHQNDHAVTRGRVDISFLNDHLESIKIDGQKKGFFSWKQETLISCENLKPVSR